MTQYEWIAYGLKMASAACQLVMAFYINYTDRSTRGIMTALILMLLCAPHVALAKPITSEDNLDNQTQMDIFNRIQHRNKRFVISGMIGAIFLAKWLFWAVPIGAGAGLVGGAVVLGTELAAESAVEAVEVIIIGEEASEASITYLEMGNLFEEASTAILSDGAADIGVETTFEGFVEGGSEAGIETEAAASDTASLNSFHSVIEEDAESFVSAVSETDGLVNINVDQLEAAYSTSIETNAETAVETAEMEVQTDFVEPNEVTTCCGAVRIITLKKIAWWVNVVLSIAGIIGVICTVTFQLRRDSMTSELLAVETKVLDALKKLELEAYKQYQIELGRGELSAQFQHDISELVLYSNQYRESLSEEGLLKMSKLMDSDKNTNIIREWLKGHLLNYNSTEPEPDHTSELDELEAIFKEKMTPENVKKKYKESQEFFDSQDNLTKKVWSKTFHDWLQTMTLTPEQVNGPKGKELLKMNFRVRQLMMSRLIQSARVRAMEDVHWDNEYQKELENHKKMYPTYHEGPDQ